MKKPTEDGATALAVLITSDFSIIVANAGDSRCVLCTNGKATPLSRDHKPGDEEEKRRIEKAGFLVMKSTEIIKGQFFDIFDTSLVFAILLCLFFDLCKRHNFLCRCAT